MKMVCFLTLGLSILSMACYGEEPLEITLSRDELAQKDKRMEASLTGNKLVLKVKSTKALGYVWNIKSDSNDVKLTDKSTLKSTDKPGGSEYETFTFNVSGSGVVLINNARPFGNPDSKSIELKITKE